MIVDTSAIVSILLRDPTSDLLRTTLLRARSKRMYVVNYVELAIVAANRLGDPGSGACDDLLRAFGVTLEPAAVRQAILARQAFYGFGKGRHPAALNLGDCFAYALAKSSGEPLLYVGLDFAETDLASPS